MPLGDAPDPRDVQDERDLAAARAPAERPGDDPVLGRVGEAARSLAADDVVFEEPPPHVWEGIAARVAGAAGPGAGSANGTSAGPDAGAGPARTPTPPGSAPTPTPAPTPAPGGPGAGDTPPPVVDLGGARRRRTTGRTWLVAAAAAAVVALVAGIATAVGRGGAEDVVASARLQPLADATSVTAELVDDDGQLQLDIPLGQADLPAPNDGFYEVWLIDEAVDGMVSLGPARDDGVYDVPDDLDYRSFPIVDVSVEPPDGDPEHSGTSVLRGTLS